MDSTKKKKLIAYLRDFVTEERWETMQKVLDQRTRYISVVLEDIYQPQNASAVLRSCDCFGVQDVHVIENDNSFRPTKSVTIGADQWMSIHKYNKERDQNTAACYQHLRNEGYQIIATSPHVEGSDIGDFKLTDKTALVFGTELDGLSDYAIKQADGYVQIPMYGFSESYNISVSAALCLYEVTKKLRSSDIKWQLNDEEKIDLELTWLENSIRAAEQLKAKFLEEE
ncbi:MAG: RNA methyltransferase [Balneolaceae bacterium]|nr:RNA methyltransferase [Balneolaceae bacterium]